jgi:hypothetical protein
LDNRKLRDLLREYSIELADDVANANITDLLCALGYYAGFRDLDARLLALACGTLFFSSLKHSVTLLPQGPVREKEKRIEKQKRKERDLIWRLCHQVLVFCTQFPSGMTVKNNKKEIFWASKFDK